MMEVSERRERHCMPIAGPRPWLVFPNGKGMRDQTFCTISSSSSSSSSSPPSINYILKSIPELRRKDIWACFHGWLLLVAHKNTDLMYLYNPISSETINLPPPNFKPSEIIKTTIFTSSPKDPNCSVFLFHRDRPIIKYCRPCDQHWTDHDYGFQLSKTIDKKDYKNPIFGAAVCCNGVLYALTLSKHLFLIQIGDHQNRLDIQCLEIFVPISEAPLICTTIYLIESYGDLFAVIVSFRGVTFEEVGDIEVFRLDFSQKVWINVKNLGDRSLFLGNDCCSSCLATEYGIEGNRIYFTMKGDKNLYYFNLEDGSVFVSLTCPKLRTPWFPPMWVTPDLRSSDNQVEGNNSINRKEGQSEDGEEEIQANREIDHHEQYWSDLPMEIYGSITDFLNLFDYMHFRTTCRLFRLAAPLIKWRTTSMRLETQFSSPWLVFLNNKNNGIFNFLDPNHHDTYFLNMPKLLFGSSIWGSKDGFLLMTRRNIQNLFFFNPFTGTIGEFPLLSHLFTPFSGIAFSSQLTSPDCLVVGISPDLGGILVSFIHVGEEEWNYYKYESDFVPNNNSPVFLDGYFYFLGRKGKLAVFRLEHYDFSWEVIDQLKVPCKSFYHNFLAECNGDLISVFVGSVGKWVKVFRLDQSKMVWTEVESLGNYTLYVSISSSFSAIARIPEMENKIYFSKLFGQAIVYYSLETEKFYCHGSNACMEDLYNTSEYLNCGWIQPSGF